MQTKVDILTALKEGRLFFDGGTGTVLAGRYGYTDPPEMANLCRADIIEELHLDYLRAGADIIKTNTFGANRMKHPDSYREMIRYAVASARRSVDRMGRGFVALDIGPTGRMIKPLGDLELEEAISVFRDTVLAGAEGCDLVLIETMGDMAETRAAVIAVKEACDLPIFVTNVYGADGKTLTGSSPLEMVTVLEAMGVSAVGMNCSLGPAEMLKLLPTFRDNCSLPIIVNPNAGLPIYRDGVTSYGTDAEEFSSLMEQIALAGGHILGGCCGTDPEYIRKMGERVKNIPLLPIQTKELCRVCSYGQTLDVDARPVLVGERINPTGKSKIKAALSSGDYSYILDQALAEEDEGAHALDVNAGLPGIDEPRVLAELTTLISSVTTLPLQLDSSDPVALEAAMRVYCGKALINSVTGEDASLSRVLPLVKKYGGVLIALTIDDGGIPEDARGRVDVALRILREAERYGLGRRDIIFDPLTLTVASGADNPRVTLEAVEILHGMGLRTSLGVSNVSFGLPGRDTVNSAFFTAALFRGLSMAIINPHSAQMMNAYRAFLALSGKDEGCREYVEKHIPVSDNPSSARLASTSEVGAAMTLGDAVRRGLADRARELAGRLVTERGAMDIIEGELIPALNAVGEDYASGRMYLPGLLRSAESASSAFSVIRESLPEGDSSSGPSVIIATVKGDIHDIGKNIVRLVTESYGYRVIDLGRDVPAESVLDAVLTHRPIAVALSALMTTTLPAMEQTVALIKAHAPEVKLIVGGAVLTPEYADSIGADRYSPDATDVVSYLEGLRS